MHFILNEELNNQSINQSIVDLYSA